MKKNRNNGGKGKYLTLEEAIKLIKEFVSTTVDKLFATHKKEMKEYFEEYFRKKDEEMQAYFQKKDEEMQAYLRKKDEEIAELREINRRLERRIEQSMDSSEAAKRGLGALVESIFENAPIQACLLLSNGKYKESEIVKMTAYKVQIGLTRTTEVDVYARTPDYEIALIAEIKNQFSQQEAEEFVEKLKEIVEEGIKYDGNMRLAKGIYGMIGGMRFKSNAREIALANGIIVATYKGDDVVLERPDMVRNWLKENGKTG